MMALPLFPKGIQNALENTPAEECPSDCEKCKLGGGGTSPGAVGDAGGILVVGEAPTRAELRAGAYPFTAGPPAIILSMLREHAAGHAIAADYALKCPLPKKGKVSAKTHQACRPHLAGTLEEVQPEIVLAFGNAAVMAVTGRSFSALKTPDGVDYMADGTVVFMFPRVQEITKNRLRREQFKRRLADIFGDDAKWPEPPPVRSKYHVAYAMSYMETEHAIKQLTDAPWFYYDTETDGIMWSEYFQINTFAACIPGSREPWVWSEGALQSPRIQKQLAKLMASPKARKAAHNLKFDSHASANFFEVEPAGEEICTLLMARLIDSECDGKLEALAEKVCMGGHKLEAKAALIEARKTVRAIQSGKQEPDGSPRERQIAANPDRTPDSWAYGYLPEGIRNRYCALDCVAGLLLAERFLDEMLPETRAHWEGLVKHTTAAVRQVEHWGIGIDAAHLDKYRSGLKHQAGEWEMKIRTSFENFTANDTKVGDRITELLPDGYNPGSAPQTATLLYDAIGIDPPKRTPGGAPSVDADALKMLSMRQQDPRVANLVGQILEWRKVEKQRSTYADGMMQHVRKDERIHPSFRIAGTTTGRMSCSEPNLQNIPRAKGGPEAKLARNLFAAPADHVLMDADYSQLELRVAAGLSGDAKMKAIFEEGVDYHQKTAEMISDLAWGIKPEQVKDQHRSGAKTVNFGLLYGQGIPALSHGIGCNYQQAERIKDAILGEFTDLNKWIRFQERRTKKYGDTWTYWEGKKARVRPLFNAAHPDEKLRASAERCSYNTPVQGTASDFCLAALIDCVGWLRDDCVPAKLILTVHDSLVFQVHQDALEEVAGGVKDIMGERDCGGVKLDVDVGFGKAWGEMVEYRTDAEEVALALGFPKTAVNA